MSPQADPTSDAANRLLQRLRDELSNPELHYVEAPARATAARFTPIWQLDIAPPHGTTRRLIARAVRSTEQLRLEVTLHKAVNCQDAGICAPLVVLVETDPTILGTPFFVMERLDEPAVLATVAPIHFALAFPRLLRSWPLQLATIAQGLAGVDTDAVVALLDESGLPRHTQPGRHLQHLASALDGVTGLEPIVEWMIDHEPTVIRRVLSHGDLWPTNVFNRTANTTLIDWNRGGIDDPALDIGFATAGFALMPEPFPPPGPLCTIAHAAGRQMTQRILNHCAPLVGGIERVRYYQALRCLLEIADVLSDPAPTGPGWSNAITVLAAHAQTITGVRARR